MEFRVASGHLARAKDLREAGFGPRNVGAPAAPAW